MSLGIPHPIDCEGLPSAEAQVVIASSRFSDARRNEITSAESQSEQKRARNLAVADQPCLYASLTAQST